MSKLEELAELEGYYDSDGMLEDNIHDSTVLGICMNKGCDYTTNVEPDCETGQCEECDTMTVKSCLILGGIL